MIKKTSFYLTSVFLALFLVGCSSNDPAPSDPADDSADTTDDSSDASDDSEDSASMVNFSVAAFYDNPLITEKQFVRVDEGSTATPVYNLTSDYGILYERSVVKFETNIAFYRYILPEPITYLNPLTLSTIVYDSYFDDAGGEYRYRRFAPQENYISVAYYKASEFDPANGNPFYVSIYDLASGTTEHLQIFENALDVSRTYSIGDYFVAESQPVTSGDTRLVVVNTQTSSILANLPRNGADGIQNYSITGDKLFMAKGGPNRLKWLDLTTGIESDELLVDQYIGNGSGFFKSWTDGSVLYFGRLLAQPSAYSAIPAYVNLTTGEAVLFDTFDFFINYSFMLPNTGYIGDFEIDPLTGFIVYEAGRGAALSDGGLFFTDFDTSFVQAVPMDILGEPIFIIR